MDTKSLIRLMIYYDTFPDELAASLKKRMSTLYEEFKDQLPAWIEESKEGDLGPRLFLRASPGFSRAPSWLGVLIFDEVCPVVGIWHNTTDGSAKHVCLRQGAYVLAEDSVGFLKIIDMRQEKKI